MIEYAGTRLFGYLVSGMFALVLAGCATPLPPSPPEQADTPIARGMEDNISIQRVHFATNRGVTGNRDPAKHFGSTLAEQLTYGVCEVSIPRDHRMGELEGPSIWRLEFTPDLTKHIVLAKIETQPSDDFFMTLRQRLSDSEGKKAFVFIHGFNVGFEEAARRTAQMHYDLAFTGVPIFFSWPSQAQFSKYREDEAIAKASEQNLQRFFADLAGNLDADEIYVIAHSLGNRQTTRALAILFQDQPQLASRFKEILLVAPDIDADVFKSEIAPALLAPGRRVTLYASSKDIALKASELVNGGQRLGDADPAIVVLPGMESIDASNVETDLIGHSYYADANSVLADMFEVVREGGGASVRLRLEEIVSALGRFWRFKPPPAKSSKPTREAKSD